MKAIQGILQKWRLRKRKVRDVEQEKKIINHVRSISRSNAEILWFGDSTLCKTAYEDTDRKSTAALYQESSGMQTRLIAGTGYHVGVYLGIAKKTVAHAKRHPYWIVCINVRSFLPQWQLNPEWEYTTENLLNKNETLPLESCEKFARTVVVIPGIGERSIAEYQLLAQSKVKSEVQRRKRLEIIFGVHYGVLLEKDNPGLRLLAEFVAYAEMLPVRTFYYITPVNYQAGTEYAPPVWKDCLIRNTNVVKGVIESSISDNNSMMDYTWLLDRKCFITPDIANEHLNSEGRAILARQILSDTRASILGNK